MSSQTVSERVIVLKKTKLGETDLILSLLCDDGRLIQAVAKGARKPNNSFAARLELTNICDVLLVVGKRLFIVKEAKIVKSFHSLRSDYLKSLAAMSVMELACATADTDICSSNFYDLALESLLEIDLSDSELCIVYTLCCVLGFIKLLGISPQLNECVYCGSAFRADSKCKRARIGIDAGGYVCEDCKGECFTFILYSDSLQTMQKMLDGSFSAINEPSYRVGNILESIEFCRLWLETHQSCRVKSLRALIEWFGD